MKKTYTFIVFAIFFPLFGWGQETAELAQPPNGNNQKAELSQWIGPVQISIIYHSPRVHFEGKERTGHIWASWFSTDFLTTGLVRAKPSPGASARMKPPPSPSHTT